MWVRGWCIGTLGEVVVVRLFIDTQNRLVALHWLSGTSGLASNPANREIDSSSGGRLSTKTFFFRFFFSIFFLKKLEKI